MTDGILLLPWLRSLEERVRRQAAGVGGDVESVLKEVGLTEDEPAPSRAGELPRKGVRGDKARVWLHCNVGGRVDEKRKVAVQGDEVS